MNIQEHIKLLKSEDEGIKIEALKELSNVGQYEPEFTEFIPVLKELLSDQNSNARFYAGYCLVNFAENNIDISSAAKELANALNDEVTDVKKEAVWALYCIANTGNDISDACETLEKCMGNRCEIRGNGAIALCLHYLNNENFEKAFELTKVNDGHIQFGAAWAHTDYSNRTKNPEPVTKVADMIRGGIMDLSLHDGIAGALQWANKFGKDISCAVDAINKLINSTDDQMKQAKLGGIFMKMNRS